MIVNFDQKIDRTHTDSKKWHKYHEEDIIPLWVADTDFKSPPAVIEALQQRVEHGVFGYGYPRPELTQIFIERIQKLYQWKIKPEWIVYLPNLASGLGLSIRAYTTTEQRSIAPHPIYPAFMKSAKSANRDQISAPIKLKNRRWILDLNAVESQLLGNEKLLMLCNPHNPGGTVYRHEELLEQLDFAQRHNLIVCSDEIHCDLILNKNLKHIPFGSLSRDAAQRSITLMSPSKAFNITGLGLAMAIIPNANLRTRFIETNADLIPDVNIFSYIAADAAYRHGDKWLEQLLNYLRKNSDIVTKRIKSIPKLKMVTTEATYLAWIDASKLPVENPHTFFEEAGVGLSAGGDFGNHRFLRLNFGCNRELLEKALDRMENACRSL